MEIFIRILVGSLQFKSYKVCRKMKYSIISNQKRSELIQRAIHNKQSIQAVALQLKIKFSSAKSIIRMYKKTGKIFDKKKVRKIKGTSKDEKNEKKDVVSRIKQSRPELNIQIKVEDQKNSLVQKFEKPQEVQMGTNQSKMLNFYPFQEFVLFNPYFQQISFPFFLNY